MNKKVKQHKVLLARKPGTDALPAKYFPQNIEI
jgi:hypothetical protein